MFYALDISKLSFFEVTPISSFGGITREIILVPFLLI